MRNIEVGIVIVGVPLVAWILWYEVRLRAEQRLHREARAHLRLMFDVNKATNEVAKSAGIDWQWPAFPKRVASFVETGVWPKRMTIEVQIGINAAEFAASLARITQVMKEKVLSAA